MKRSTTRRSLLAALGLGTFSVAGCVQSEDLSGFFQNGSDDDDGTGDPDDGNGNGNGENGGNGDGNGEADDGNGNGNGDIDPSETVWPAIEHGEIIDDFEEIDLWGAIPGSQTVDVALDTDDRVQGDHSLRAVTESSESAGAFRAYPNGVDLEDKHVSAAIKVEADGPVRVAFEAMAPHRSDHVSSVRYVVPGMDDWFRVDFGYTGQRGEPNLGSAQELQVYARSTETTSIRFRVDDLRTTEMADHGAAILLFIGNDDSHYEEAYPILEEHEVPGTAAVTVPGLNASGALDIGQLRGMRDSGWDVCAHPYRNEPFSEMSEDEKRNVLEGDHEYLKQRGFPDGSRHFSSPRLEMDAETLSIIRDVYETSFVFGANTNALPSTDPHMLSWVYGQDDDEVRRLVRLSDRYSNLLVLTFDGVREGGSVTPDELDSLLSYLESRDLSVITPSQLVDEYQLQSDEHE